MYGRPQKKNCFINDLDNWVKSICTKLGRFCVLLGIRFVIKLLLLLVLKMTKLIYSCLPVYGKINYY